MEKLTLKVKRVNNTVNGNPRYQVLSFDNTEAMDLLIKKRYFRELKKGLFTASDYCFCYGLENKEGVTLENILVKGVC